MAIDKINSVTVDDNSNIIGSARAKIYGVDIDTGGIPSNLVAHYKFNGNGNDEANGNAATVSGATYVTAVDGQGINFDGVNDYASIPSNSSTSVTVFTISALVYIPVSVQSGWRAIYEHGRFTSSWYGIFKSGSVNKFHFRWGQSNSFDFNSLILPDTWYHVVCAYDGSSAKMYLDGVLDEQINASSGLVATDTEVRIGQNMTGGESFKGYVDDLRLYNQALTQTEITNLYNTYIFP